MSDRLPLFKIEQTIVTFQISGKVAVVKMIYRITEQILTEKLRIWSSPQVILFFSWTLGDEYLILWNY